MTKRIKSIKMNGKSCPTYNSKSVLECHCNDCYNNIIEYLGKEKGKTYFYDGDFAPEFLRNQKVIITSFCADENEKTSSCECTIQLYNGEGGQMSWIPRKEIIKNLHEIKEK